MSAKKILLLLLFLSLASVSQAEALPRVLVICTDVSECGIVMGVLGGTYPSPPGPKKLDLGWLIEVKWKEQASISVFQPRYGGATQLHQLKTLEELLAAEKLAGKPYDLLIAVGTAGGRGNSQLGDVAVYADYEYLINERVDDILRESAPIMNAGPQNWFEIISALKGLKLKRVPYNDSPKFVTDAPCVTVTSFTMGEDRKKIAEKFGCFQKNDYVSAVAARNAKIPLVALRVISDVTPLPEQAVTSISDSLNWSVHALGEKRGVRIEPLFYSKFKELYLSQLYTVLPAVLESWQKGLKRH